MSTQPAADHPTHPAHHDGSDQHSHGHGPHSAHDHPDRRHPASTEHPPGDTAAAPAGPHAAGHDARGAHAGHGGGHGGHGDHAAQFRDRFWWSLVLAVPVVVFSHMFAELLGYSPPAGTTWIPPVLGTVLFFYGGWPFLTGAAAEIRSRRPGMMLLVAMAITVAFVASGLTTLGVGNLNLDFWWELALLVVIMLLGHWLEMRALGQASGALDALAALLPDSAERVDATGGTQSVPVGELAPGNVVLVRPGARVPADGQILDGRGHLDESMITGESRAVARSVGDRVVAGTVVTDAALRVRVTAVGEGTALAGIRRLVEEAQTSRSRAQALADRAAAALFWFAAVAGVLTFAVWMIIGNPQEAIERTVTVLVIACPHALGLAIPLVIAISTATAAKAGILVKDRLALERMRRVDTVLFDKTGTLTKGRPAVVDVIAVPGTASTAGTAGPVGAVSTVDTDSAVGTGGTGDTGDTGDTGSTPGAEDAVLALAGAAEADSEHPLARAVVTAAAARGPVPPATGFTAIPGHGVAAQVAGDRVMVGGPRSIADAGPLHPRVQAAAHRWAGQGATVLYVQRNERVVGALALADEIRPESAEAIEQLHRRGVRVAMITGDARTVADAVAAQLGVDEVFAEVLPADKDRKVADLQARGHRVAMVGDGVNDAPALARADVGIAIGAGTDVAVESAGVVLADDDPRLVVGVRALSTASYRKMQQNLAWAVGYNVVSVPLAAGVLAGVGVVLAPAVGAVLMSVSTIVVALNAQLLRRLRLRSL